MDASLPFISFMISAIIYICHAYYHPAENPQFLIIILGIQLNILTHHKDQFQHTHPHKAHFPHNSIL